MLLGGVTAGLGFSAIGGASLVVSIAVPGATPAAGVVAAVALSLAGLAGLSAFGAMIAMAWVDEL
jgi:hypothetical protein